MKCCDYDTPAAFFFPNCIKKEPRIFFYQTGFIVVLSDTEGPLWVDGLDFGRGLITADIIFLPLWLTFPTNKQGVYPQNLSSYF